MWTAAGQQVAEKMSPASAAKIGTVGVILMIDLIGPLLPLAAPRRALRRSFPSGPSVDRALFCTTVGRFLSCILIKVTAQRRRRESCQRRAARQG